MSWNDLGDNVPVGTLMTSAAMQNWFRENQLWLYNVPHVRLSHSTSQSCSPGATEIGMDTEDSDAYGMHAGSNSHATLNRTGVWGIEGECSVAADATGYRYLRIKETSILKGYGRGSNAAAFRIIVCGHEYLGSGAEVSLEFSHNSGGALTVTNAMKLAATWWSAGA
jgi:hypothetical protein